MTNANPLACLYHADDARDRQAFGALPGYAPPAEFPHGEWALIADVPADWADGRAVQIYEARYPARFFRIEVAESAKGPGMILTTGSGEGEMAADLAKALASGRLSVRSVATEPPGRVMLRQVANALEDTLAGAVPAISLRECLQAVLKELEQPATESPLFKAARRFLAAAKGDGEHRDRAEYDEAYAELESWLVVNEMGTLLWRGPGPLTPEA